MSKTVTAVRHFGLGGRESLETAVMAIFRKNLNSICFLVCYIASSIKTFRVTVGYGRNKFGLKFLFFTF